MMSHELLQIEIEKIKLEMASRDSVQHRMLGIIEHLVMSLTMYQPPADDQSPDEGGVN